LADYGFAGKTQFVATPRNILVHALKGPVSITLLFYIADNTITSLY
jgi:hypothetical protein